MRKKVLFWLVVLYCCTLSPCQEHSAVSRSQHAGNDLARLRSKFDVEPLLNLTADAVAGHYSSSPDELRQRVGPLLGGDDLYLFPDGAYFYYVWCDVCPDTIRDKGTWVVSENEIRLTSDPDVKWKPGAERDYLLVRRRSHAKEILAIGTDRDMRYFEERAKDDPEFMLLLVSKVRVKELSRAESIELKEKLMREAWRPEFYKSE